MYETIHETLPIIRFVIYKRYQIILNDFMMRFGNNARYIKIAMIKKLKILIIQFLIIPLLL